MKDPLSPEEQFFETILDLFPGMVSVVSPDFRVLYVNRRLKERSTEDPLGKPCYRVFHGLEAPCPWCKKDEVLTYKKTLVWEVLSPKDQRWYEVYSIPFPFQGVWSYLSVILDVTEKKHLEEKLERQLHFFRRILDQNPALILFNQGGRITFVNRAFEEITGFSQKEALGQEVFKLFVPSEDLETWRKHCEEVRCGIFQQGVELPIKTKEGKKRYLLWNCMQVEDPEGRPVVIGLALDITQQKELFEQYLQAQKMESLGRFSGVLLHELNNLFMAIQGYLGIAKMQLSHPEKVREYLEKIEQLIGRWRSMSQDLLAFTKKSPGVAQKVDLARFLLQYRETWEQLLGSKIKLEIKTPTERIWIQVNPVHLQQILFNLLSNAREAMPEGGRVEIALEKIVLPEETARLLDLTPGPFVVLSFQDTGSGIPPEALPHIFEPYFTTKEQGSGLGLATVYSLIKQYRGHVAVYTSPEKGTLFRLYFPLAPEAERDLDLNPSFYQLLVVSEGPSRLKALKELLEHLGYRPHLASSLEEARELIAQGLSPEVLFLDLERPVEEVSDFIKELKGKFPDLKIITVSGKAPPVLEDEEFFYLLEPLEPETLSAVLKQALTS